MNVVIPDDVLREATDCIAKAGKLGEAIAKEAAAAEASAEMLFETLQKNGHCDASDKGASLKKLASVADLQLLVSSLSNQLATRPRLGRAATKEASSQRSDTSAADTAFYNKLNSVN